MRRITRSWNETQTMCSLTCSSMFYESKSDVSYAVVHKSWNTDLYSILMSADFNNDGYSISAMARKRAMKWNNLHLKPRVGSITDDNEKSNCFMIENIPSKGVCFYDFIAIFAMSYQIFACFSFPNTKISENSDGAKP